MSFFEPTRTAKYSLLSGTSSRSTSPKSLTSGQSEEEKGLLGLRSRIEISVLSSKKQLLLTTFNVLVLLTTLSIWGVKYLKPVPLNADLRRVSTYSPVFDIVDLELQTKMVNGTFFPNRHQNMNSVARHSTDQEIDEIWADWELARILPITRNNIVKMGKDPTTAVKLEDHLWGLGDDVYAGIFDVYHQIHCLNSLRQIAYGKFYNRTMVLHKNKKISLKRYHVDHCVDILLQALQCSGNLNIITYHWLETQQYPFPDMSVNRKCTAFDKLTDWRRANTLDMDKYIEVMKKPEGVKERPMADQWYEYWGVESPNHPGGANPGEDFNI